jgi:hypothetical protein
MKIELILSDDINEKCSGSSCFDAVHKHQVKAINDCKRIQGVCIINNETYKFSFNPYFMDGDVFTTPNSIKGTYYSMVKTIVVEYVYANRDSLSKNDGRVSFHKQNIKELEDLKLTDPSQAPLLDRIISEEKKLIGLS